MPIQLTDKILNEKSTGVVQADFTDEDGADMVPSSIVWSLTDASGSVINSRDQVSITPASTIYIVLKNLDLAISANFDGEAEERRVTVEAVYNSTYGNSLPLKDSATFWINDLIKIT